MKELNNMVEQALTNMHESGTKVILDIDAVNIDYPTRDY